MGGSVNTGFRLGLLSIVRTTGHARAEMLNVSTRSICLLRKGNGTFPSHFPLLVDSQISEITAVQIPSPRAAALQLAGRGGGKKKVKIRSLQTATTFVCSVILWESPNATALSPHLSRNIEL